MDRPFEPYTVGKLIMMGVLGKMCLLMLSIQREFIEILGIKKARLRGLSVIEKNKTS